MKKICSKCKKKKDLDEFYTARGFADGRTYECKLCMTKYRKSRLSIQREYMRNLREKNRDSINERKRSDWHNLSSEERVFRQAKNRSKRKGMDFNISIEDIIVPEKCPILEVPLVKGTKENYELTPSLDRIDNSKGYIKGNVQIISKKANSMKNSASIEDMRKFAKWIIKTFGV